MRIIILLIFLGFFLRASAQGKLYTEKIQMDYKSASLKAENLKQVRRIWECLPPEASVELMLVSEKEISKLNPLALVTLSKARADAITLFLTTQKIVSPFDVELNTHSFTESEVIHGTDTVFKRIARNPYKVYSLILSKEVPLCFHYTEAERKALSSKEPAVFSVSATHDEMITGPDGVVVLIPAYSFILPPGKAYSEVTIRLWEFTSTEDIIAAGLNTMSAGRLLETGGMIYITAEYEGTCLKMLRSSRIIIRFPTYGKLRDMRLFRGIPAQKNIDWQKTSSTDQVNAPALPETMQETEGGEKPDLSYYVLESAGLGWINCDRFADMPEAIDVVFRGPENFTGIAGLVFTGISSVMQGEIMPAKNNKVGFSRVPGGKEAVLLFYAFSADKKKVSYSARKVILGETSAEDIPLREVSLAEFTQILKNIKG